MGSKTVPFEADRSAALLDVLVDGEIVEVYAGGGAVAFTAITHSGPSATHTIAGAGCTAAVEAWPLRAPPTGA